jgi:hypothetical protein
MAVVNKASTTAKPVATSAPAKAAPPPQEQEAAAAPPQEAPAKDTFTPAQAPAKGPSIDGYSKPVDAKDLPDVGNGVGVMTLNSASGADGPPWDRDQYRKADNREKQANLIKESGATIVGFQEADVGVNRTDNVNTALDVARRANSAFEPFFDPNNNVPTVSMDEPAPDTAIRKGADGTTIYQTPGAALVTGESFSGDDRAINKDAGADASYGNALYVAEPNQLVEAYTVSLPRSAGGPDPASPELVGKLASGGVSAEERAELGKVNEAVRDAPGSEPRSALVARVKGPDGKERTIINTHLSSVDNPEERKKQIEYLAQLVKAETQANPGREVVVMGDFNSSTAEVGAGLEGAGMHREVGGKKEADHNFDQVWVTNNANTDTSAQVNTNGTSDHDYAGYTVLR